MAADEPNALYAAIGAAREAMADGASASRPQDPAPPPPSEPAAPPMPPAPAATQPTGASLDASRGGAWAVLGAFGPELYSLLSAWDEQRVGSCSRDAFRRAAQALAALGVCVRAPTRAELDAMFDVLAGGQPRLRIARLKQPLDAIAAALVYRLSGIEHRSWLEIDRWADASYDWYMAARALRRNPGAWREAAAARKADPYAADRLPSTLHLFAAEPGGWGEDGHLVELAACALLLVDREGRGAARLTQLSVAPSRLTDDFAWEWRLLDAADLLAEQRGHLWLTVSAAADSKWREALVSRGYKPRQVPPGEPDGEWLIKATPLRDSV